MMEEIKWLPLSDLKLDVVGRMDQDDPDLEENLVSNGQREALRVEGPDKDGKYIIISGIRRFQAMKKRVGHFVMVQCIVFSLTSRADRAVEILSNHQKRRTRFERQILIKEALNNGMSEKELAKRINKPVWTIKRESKGMDIPEQYRREVEQVKGSQDALVTIFNKLNCDKSYRNTLYKRLLAGEIGSEDSRALNRLVKHNYYEFLNDKQKRKLIENTLNTCRFTNEKASELVLLELMKDDPQNHADYVNDWVIYICHEIERIASLINPEMNEMISPFQKKRIKSAMSKLKNSLKWAYGERRGNGYKLNLRDDIDDEDFKRH